MKRRKGKIAEDLACKALEDRGFTVVERNFNTRFGEIDIVALKNGIYYFVEVRSISSDMFSSPAETLSARKLERFRKALYIYIRKHRIKRYRTLFIGLDLRQKDPRSTFIYDFLEE